MTITQVDYNSDLYWKSLRLREIILRLPINRRYSKSEIENESEELIFVGQINTKVVATCQFVLENTHAKMRQVATAKAYQGMGFGGELYKFCESELVKRGIKEIYCHARKNAILFYEKLNFTAVSEEFQEVGIPHVKMKKDI